MATTAATTALDYLGVGATIVGFLTWAHSQWRTSRREEHAKDEALAHKVLQEHAEELAAQRAAIVLAQEHHLEAIAKLSEELAKARATIDALRQADAKRPASPEIPPGNV